MSKSLISIIVPCYNGKRYIERCFDSILKQSYKSIEVIAVDDGSTDGSYTEMLTYVQKFTANGMALKVITQANRGPGGAIDTGLKHISGEYLMLLDIDDLLLPKAAQSLLSAFDGDVAVVRCDGYYVNENSTDTPSRKFTDVGEGETKDSLFDALVYGTAYNWAGSYMAKTSVLFDFYPDKSIYPSRFGQNLQILMPLAYKGKCAFVHIPLMKYVQREDSLSHSAVSDRNILGYLDIRETLLEHIVVDEAKKQEYKSAVRTKCYRQLLELYCLSGNMSKARKALRILRKEKSLCKNDIKLYLKYILPFR